MPGIATYSRLSLQRRSFAWLLAGSWLVASVDPSSAGEIPGKGIDRRTSLSAAEALRDQAIDAFSRRDYAGALKSTEGALAAAQRELPVDDIRRVRFLNAVAVAEVASGHAARAVIQLDEAIAIAEKTPGVEPIVLAELLTNQIAANARTDPLLRSLEGDLTDDDSFQTRDMTEQEKRAKAIIAAEEDYYLRIESWVGYDAMSLAAAGAFLGPTAGADILLLDAYSSIADGDHRRGALYADLALAVASFRLAPDDLRLVKYLRESYVSHDFANDPGHATTVSRRIVEICASTPGCEAILDEDDRASFLGSGGDPVRAETLWNQILEKRRKSRDPQLVDSLVSVADVALENDHIERATALYEEALTHENLDYVREQLATALQLRGLYAAAQVEHAKIVASSRKSYANAPHLLIPSLTAIAGLYDAQGQVDKSQATLEEALEIADTHVSSMLAERGYFGFRNEQAVTNTLAGLQDLLDQAVSLAFAHPTPANVTLAFESVLRWKGRSVDIAVQTAKALSEHLPPTESEAMEQWGASQAQLGTLLQCWDEADRRNHFRLLNLEERVAALTERLTRVTAQFRSTPAASTVSVRALLPTDTALVEMAVYRPFAASAHSIKQRWLPPRYAAFVLTTNGLQAMDLGPAESIDRNVGELRRSLMNGSGAVESPAARALHEQTFGVFEPSLGKVGRVILSPDGALLQAPFSVFVSGDGRYALERYEIGYVSSGRDLQGFGVKSSPAGPPAAFVAPAYDTQASPAQQRATNCRRPNWSPLPETTKEFDALKLWLPAAVQYAGAAASEEALRSIHQPRVLHIATHGFFRADPASRLELVGETIPPVGQRVRSMRPLVNAGLALAGANVPPGSQDDGVITALELATLDLRGTELAVLSACESGVSEISNGQGVSGFRRALAAAGAERQLTTLWKIPSDATTQLVALFYQGLQKGLGHAAALRAAQMGMSSQYRHPFFWAAFTASGNWRPLDAGAAPTVSNGTSEPRAAKQTEAIAAMERGNAAKTSSYPGRGPVEPHETAWRFAAASKTSSPTIANAAVYFTASDGFLYAITAQSGNLLWKHALRGQEPQLHTPAAGPDTVVAAGDGVYSAVDAATGALRWEIDAQSVVVEDPLIVEDEVYIIAGGKVLAVSARDGKIRWTFEQQRSLGKLVVLGDVIAVKTSVANTLHGIDRKTGKERWKIDSKAQTGPSWIMGVEGQFVYGYTNCNPGGGCSSEISSVASSSGNRIWSGSFEGSTFPASAGGSAYIGTNSSVRAFDVKTGNLRWQTDSLNEVISIGPSIADSRLYIAGSSKLFVIKVGDGKGSAAEFVLPSSPWTELAVGEGLVVFGGEDGAIYAVR